MKLFRIFLIAAIGFALVGIALLLFAYGTAFDPAVSNYFSAGSPLPILSAIALILAICCGGVGAFLARKAPDGPTTPPVPSFATSLAALGALGSAIWLMKAGNTWLGILLFCASVFFMLEFCAIAKLYGGIVLWLGFAAIAATIAYNAVYYFDMKLQMNAPTKILLQMALLSAMLFITAECRLLLNRFSPFLIPLLTVFCMTLCLAAGLVVFYLLISKKVTRELYLAVAPFLVGIGLTAFLRLLQMLIPEKKQPEPILESIETVEKSEIIEEPETVEKSEIIEEPETVDPTESEEQGE